MKTLVRFSFVMLLVLSATFSKGQSVMDPTDPVITYSASNPPTQPAWGQVGKWVRTKRLSWNTDAYKAYIYKGVPFRLKFPKTYNPTANDGKRYPMLVFYHGMGEAGNFYDNEYSLLHGGQLFMNAVNNGVFDGFVFVMQSTGGWGDNHAVYINEIIQYMIANNKLDPFAITVNGLSSGGYQCWNTARLYPAMVARAMPMSGISVYETEPARLNIYKFEDISYYQGGKDGAPAPYTAWQVRDAIWNVGGKFRYTEYPNLGHGTWNTVWGEPDFWPQVNGAYAANPHALFGRTEFCLNDPINVVIGVSVGFNEYQWRRDGQPYGGNSNSIVATSFGVYDVRVRLGSVWSEWSRVPVHIKEKGTTVTPPITVDGMSRVLPALDRNDVTLKLPTGYNSYTWQRVGSGTTLGTNSTLTVTTPGNYIARVTEQFGCASNWSIPFTVVDANGTNKPDAPINLLATSLSKTSIKLDWNDNPTPQFNETGFEIYKSLQPNGPYSFVTLTGADVRTATINDLEANTQYFFKLRAVNETAASLNSSNEATAKTDADMVAPTAPTNLSITGTTRSSISFTWSPATDDVEVTKYLIYVNGLLSYTTTDTKFTVQGLQANQSYNIQVKAKDGAGNESPFSSQVTAQTNLNGLYYKYYTFSGEWTSLPDFNTLTPVKTGVSTTVDLSPRTQEDNFAFLWEGYLKVTTAGTYNLRTTSDDGSRVWLGPLNGTISPYTYSGSPLINNDGLHGNVTVASSNVSLSVGLYPIAIAYYEQGGGSTMTLEWRRNSGSWSSIPASAFTDNVGPGGSAPAAPSNLLASAVSFNQINLSWSDNSNNETGFEIYRSTNMNSGFNVIGLAPANATSYEDKTVEANTTYYYQLRSIGQYGESDLVSNYPSTYTDAIWKFNNNLTDASGNGRNLSQSNNPTYDASNKMEGTHSINFNGSNQMVTPPTSGSFLQTSYNQKTIAFWMRSTNNTNNRIIVDIGGSDDGLALRLNQNRLYAGAASNNNRSNFYVNYSTTNTWTHVALVYSGNQLRLYLDGVQAGSTNLSFSSIGTTSNGHRIGGNNSSNAFNTGTGYFSGKIDDFHIYSRALSTTEIGYLMNGQPLPQSSATTPNLPGVPATPSNLVASGISTSAINLTWNNVAGETKYQIFRSSGDNSNYLMLTEVPANTTSYEDAGLFGNSVFYYKVRAVNEGGNSGYSNEDSAITKNLVPVIEDQVNRSARYGVPTVINFSASDADGDALSFTAQNLPSFASFVDNGNKTATLTINAAQGDMGVYSNIRVTVTDTHGGSDFTEFTLTINDNYDPVVAPIANYTVAENDMVSIPLSATDQNPADVLTWSVADLPDNYTLIPGANGSATLQIQPNYAGSGTYTVTVSVSDGKGGTGTRQFTLTVNDRNPNTSIYVRAYAGNAVSAPWNNFAGVVTNNLVNEHGASTGVGVSFSPSNWWATFNEGASTGNNSGVYPDAVLRDYYYFGIFGGPETVNVSVTGLNPARKYNLTMLGSSIWAGAPNNGTTTYSSGGQTVSLNVQSNTQNTVTLASLTPNASGTIVFTMAKAPGAPAGFLNSLVITELFDDGTAPAAPKFLSAQNVQGQGVQVSWEDVAYNENGYEVWRSTSSGGTYTLRGTTQAGATTYIDNSVSGGATYYYKVRGFNNQGQSAYSNIASVTTINRVPTLNSITDIVLKSNESLAIQVIATDDASDQLTLTAANLPSFVTFTDNGNGTGLLDINPSAGSLGAYSDLSITVKDSYGESNTVVFSLFVTDPHLVSTYVNFTTSSNIAPQPWNNFTTLPFPNTAINNLKDEGNNNAGFTITLTDGWQGTATTGFRPRNGDELYPESVNRNAIFFGDNATRRITINGLNTSRRYNFVFFNSHDISENVSTNYTINGTTVTLNGSYNANRTVHINGVTPNASGQVVINVTKGSGAVYAMLSSLVIQSYVPGAVSVFGPTNLKVVGKKRTSLSIQWQDRANNETNYEVYRAADGSGSYSLVATLGANVTTYTDNNVTQNRTYHYIVRARNNSVYSAYSNVVSATTYSNVVYVNFNTVPNSMGTPWNNINDVPQTGMEWDNFRDDAGIVTNIGLINTGQWDGMYGGGVNTGNNSGVYPDKVLLESYGLFAGNTASVKLKGLNLAMKYDLTFLGSATGVFNADASYTVNGKSVILNANSNSKGTVTMYDVEPDENGEVLIVVSTVENSQFGLLNSLVIQGYIPTDNSAPQAPGTANKGEDYMVENKAEKTDILTVSEELKVYPNPFEKVITVQVPATETGNARIVITDVLGRIVYQNQVQNAGGTTISVDGTGRGLELPGVYMMNVTNLQSGTSKSFKLVKR